MKKINLLLVALCALLLAACSFGKTDSPKGIVSEYLDCIKAGNYDKAVKCFYFEKEKSETELSGIATKLGEGYNKNGGLDKYEIVSEEIEKDEAGKDVKGNVMVKLYYKDGTDKEETMKAVKDNNGKWKIDYSVK
jgi:hypothetical protein